MLPDLRVVLAAVISTFICTVGVGFYASSRLLQEPLTTRTDNPEDSPINRIALSWPEPLPPERTLNLDFAVTAKVAKNPVRDISEPSGQPESNAVATRSSPASEDQEKAAQTKVTKESTAEIGKEVAKEIAKEIANEPSVERADKLAAGPSLVEPDPHRLETDPAVTGSVSEARQVATPRAADQTTASLPDQAETPDAAASKGEPTTRIRIVKKPATGKVRAKRKRQVAVTPLSAFPGTAAEAQFPFLFFIDKYNMN